MKELQALYDHDVWDIVPFPRHKCVIPVKWVFTIKDNGTPKARLVVVGIHNTEPYSKNETSSPTSNPISLCWTLVHAAKFGWNITQLDVSNAFLHGKIDREKYIRIPPGVNYDPKKYACKLKRALY